MTVRSKLLVIGEGLSSALKEAGPPFGHTWIVRQVVMRNNSGATGSFSLKVLYEEPIADLFAASVLNTNFARMTDWFALQFPGVLRIQFTQSGYSLAIFGADLTGLAPDPDPVFLL